MCRGRLTLFVYTLVAAMAWGQSPAKPLTNHDVVAMAKSGLSTAVIVAKVEHAQAAFDTSPSALKALQQAGVPDSVIVAMLESSPTNIPAPPAIIKTNLAIVKVDLFRPMPGVAWPYDPHQIQSETVALLTQKDKRIVPVAAAAPNQPGLFVLHGDILSWKAGNKAAEAFIGFGLGRENSRIHFWLTRNGKTVYSQTDTVRSSMWQSGIPVADQLAEPLATKIEQRLEPLKLLNDYQQAGAGRGSSMRRPRAPNH